MLISTKLQISRWNPNNLNSQKNLNCLAKAQLDRSDMYESIQKSAKLQIYHVYPKSLKSLKLLSYRSTDYHHGVATCLTDQAIGPAF